MNRSLRQHINCFIKHATYTTSHLENFFLCFARNSVKKKYLRK
jgi:hypothetical protein